MSNPNSSLSVIILVVLDTTNKLIDQKFPLVTCQKRRFPQLSRHPFSQKNVVFPQTRIRGPESKILPGSSQVLALSFTKLSLYRLTKETITVIMSRPQFHPTWSLNLHMHGLIFNISI